MVMLAALAAFLIRQTKPAVPPAPTPGSMTLLGQNVPLQPPTPGAKGYAQNVVDWPGWGPLRATDSTVASAYLVDGDWSGLPALWSAAQPSATAPVWRVKVLLVTDTDTVSTLPDGTLEECRSAFDRVQTARVLQALVLAARAIEAQTGGRIRVAYDVFDDDELYEANVKRGELFDAVRLRAYATPRINAGGFDANDDVYRGPYSLCLLIHAALEREPSTRSEACFTPVAGIAAAGGADSVSQLATTIVEQNAWAASWWLARQGLRSSKPDVGAPVTRLWTLFDGRTPEQIATAIRFGPVNRASFDADSKSPPVPVSPWDRITPTAPSTASTNAKVTLFSDPDKGPAVHVSIRSETRSGGFAIPTPKNLDEIASGPNHFLVFEVKTLSKDALGIGPIVDGKPSGPGIELGERPDPGLAADVPVDGAWHKVAIDLSQLVQPGKTGGLYFGPLPGQSLYPRTSIIDIEYSFANFSLAASAPADVVPVRSRDGLAWLGRLAPIRAALAAPTVPANATILNLALADPDESVRLNTLALIGKAKLPGFEEKIAANVGDLDPRIVEAAVAALASLDTPAARKALDGALQSGAPLTRAFAAMAVAQRKDEHMAGRIGSILLMKNWHVRLMGAVAEAKNGGPFAQTFIAGITRDDDPAVREGVLPLLDASDAEVMRGAVLFVSVNDPSDAVRAAACEKLLQCSTAELRHEGLRGATDDSPWVRVQVLDYLGAHATVEALPALRQAVTSPFAAVRAAALDALAANPSPITFADVSPAASDSAPEVEIALIRLAVAKKLALPADLVTRLKQSNDPNVASEAGKLGS